MRYHQYWYSIWHDEKPGWESENSTPWMTAGAVIALLALGAWALLALAEGAAYRLVGWLMGA